MNVKKIALKRTKKVVALIKFFDIFRIEQQYADVTSPWEFNKIV